jgi:hypothetical protein
MYNRAYVCKGPVHSFAHGTIMMSMCAMASANYFFHVLAKAMGFSWIRINPLGYIDSIISIHHYTAAALYRHSMPTVRNIMLVIKRSYLIPNNAAKNRTL